MPISIHVPLAGNVQHNVSHASGAQRFLSTFPLRGTSEVGIMHKLYLTISIHVPLAGNVGAWSSGNLDAPVFLSTFPLRGTSRMSTHPLPATGNFYPRSPCGERQQPGVRDARVDVISIHVPLAGNVPACNQASSVRRNFYPRSPCGERPLVVNRVERIFLNFYPRSPCGERHGLAVRPLLCAEFLSTFPLRGTSRMAEYFEKYLKISIHVPLAGNVPP